MAIQVNLQSSDYGVPFDAAYFRIILTTIVRRDSSTKFIGKYAKLWLDIADKDGNINSNY